MHKFGIWYFEWGYAVATVVTTVIGFNANRAKHPGRWMAGAIGGALLIGGIAFYGKYHA